MTKGILGKKVGMTQIFTEAGDLHRAVQVQLGQQGFGHVQEVVEFQEV